MDVSCNPKAILSTATDCKQDIMGAAWWCTSEMTEFVRTFKHSKTAITALYCTEQRSIMVGWSTSPASHYNHLPDPVSWGCGHNSYIPTISRPPFRGIQPCHSSTIASTLKRHVLSLPEPPFCNALSRSPFNGRDHYTFALEPLSRFTIRWPRSMRFRFELLEIGTSPFPFPFLATNRE